MVELSKKFSVASRHTSLLVLESEAMMTAFGLKRAVTPLWTGESSATATSSKGDGPDEQEALALGNAGTLGAGKNALADPSYAKPADESVPSGGLDSFGAGSGRRAAGAGVADGPRSSVGMAQAPVAAATAAAPAPAPPPPPPKEMEKKKDVAADKAPAKPSRRASPQLDFDDMPRSRAPRMVAMKKVWDRKGTFIADLGAWHDRDGSRIIAAEGASAAKPDSRQVTKDLFALYEQHGRMDRAGEVAQRWATRDALDPEALLARADVAARGGDRKLAVRILGSVVDIRPDDATLQNRLASLYEQLGDRGRACAHRVALAEQKADDLAAQAAAVRCARTEGMTDLADRILADVASDKKAAVQKSIDNPPTVTTDLRGDVRMDASWDAEADLDLALIDKNGQRLSWLGGGKAPVSFTAPTGLRSESLAFANLSAGSYVIEVNRTTPSPDQTPIRGTITLRVVGETRQIPFTLTGNRLELGRADVSYTSRLVPY
jgi:tetratricopeptide (TPR) repeat protein